MNKNMKRFYDVEFFSVAVLGLVNLLIGIWIGANPDDFTTNEWFRSFVLFVSTSCVLKYIAIGVMFAGNITLTWAVFKIIEESKKAKKDK